MWCEFFVVGFNSCYVVFFGIIRGFLVGVCFFEVIFFVYEEYVMNCVFGLVVDFLE